jgi:hypothetical protein
MKKTKRTGKNANLIHGNPSGGGGIDDKAKTKNLIHGTVESCKSMDPNHVKGPSEGGRYVQDPNNYGSSGMA